MERREEVREAMREVMREEEDDEYDETDVSVEGVVCCGFRLARLPRLR